MQLLWWRFENLDLIYGEFGLSPNSNFSSFPFQSDGSRNMDSLIYAKKFRLHVQRLSLTEWQKAKIVFDRTIGIAIGFVGDLSNYFELKAEFDKEIICDGELLIALYRKYGLNFVDKLDGLFSLVLIDLKKERIYLMQDRFGSTQYLFWFVHENKLIFSTDVKLMLKYCGFSEAVDLVALRYFLEYNFVFSSRTMFKGINKLVAGQMIVFSHGAVNCCINTYFSKKSIQHTISDFEKAYIELMTRTVERQVKATNKQVGFQISGGYDSNLIIALANKIKQNPMHLFSIGTKEENHEVEKVRKIVGSLYKDAVYHEYIINGREILELPKILYNFGELVSEPSILLNYCCSRMVKADVDFIIGGEGADQVLSSDPIPRQLIPFYLKIRAYAQSLFRLATKRIKKFQGNYIFTDEAFKEKELRKLFKTSLPKISNPLYRGWVDDRFLKGLLLKKVTHKYFDVGARFPYIGSDVYWFAKSLPNKLKKNKSFHKRVVKSFFPVEIQKLFEKRGGGTPAHLQFEDLEVRKRIFNYLRNSGVLFHYFNMKEIEKLIDSYSHLAGVEQQICANKLFNLLAFETWFRLFIKKEPPEKIIYQ